MIDGLLFASDVEASVVSLKDKEDIKTLIPPALLFHTGEFPILEEVWDISQDKKVPHHIFLKTDVGNWYQDSALVETDFSPSPNAETLFSKYMKSSIALEKFLVPKGYYALFAPVSKFNEEMISKLGTEDVYQASIAGCNPDLDAIDSHYISETVSLEGWEFRGVGGHLHMSISKEYGDILHEKQRLFVRLLAITVGNVGVAVADEPKLEKIRKEVFGNPGRYRAKTYPDGRMGIEYRSLSASWLRSLETVEQVINAAKFSISLLIEDEETAEDIVDYFLPSSITAVLSMDKKESKEILKKLQLD